MPKLIAAGTVTRKYSVLGREWKKLFCHAVGRWFVHFLWSVLSWLVYILSPGVMGLAFNFLFHSLPLMSNAHILTGATEGFPVVYELTWLTSVLWSCSHPSFYTLLRCSSVCSTVLEGFALSFSFFFSSICCARKNKLKHVLFLLSTEVALVCTGPCGSSIHSLKPCTRKSLWCFISCWSDWSQEPPAGLWSNSLFYCSKGMYSLWCYVTIGKYGGETGKRELEWGTIIIFLLTSAFGYAHQI